MNFVKGLYFEGLSILRRTMPFAVFAVLGEYAHQVLKEITNIGSGHFVISILIWSYLANAAHADILLPADRNKREDQKRILGFAARTFGLCLTAFVPMVLVVWLYIPDLTSENSTRHSQATLFAIAWPTLAISALLVLTLFGTLLPAYIAGTGRGLSAAFARGTGQLRSTAGRLIIGPGIVVALAIWVFNIPGSMFDAFGPLLASNFVPDPITTTAALIGFTLEAFAVVLTALILSKAFLRDQQQSNAS